MPELRSCFTNFIEHLCNVKLNSSNYYFLNFYLSLYFFANNTLKFHNIPVGIVK